MPLLGSATAPGKASRQLPAHYSDCRDSPTRKSPEVTATPPKPQAGAGTGACAHSGTWRAEVIACHLFLEMRKGLRFHKRNFLVVPFSCSYCLSVQSHTLPLSCSCISTHTHTHECKQTQVLTGTYRCIGCNHTHRDPHPDLEGPS